MRRGQLLRAALSLPAAALIASAAGLPLLARDVTASGDSGLDRVVWLYVLAGEMALVSLGVGLAALWQISGGVIATRQRWVSVLSSSAAVFTVLSSVALGQLRDSEAAGR